MTFVEAQKRLQNGDTVFRKAWNGNKVLEPKKGVNIFHITQEDIEADDWETEISDMDVENKNVEINLEQFTNLALEALKEFVSFNPVAANSKSLLAMYISLLAHSIFKFKNKEDK